MGFWDTIQSYIPETERTKMYKAENALRMKQLEREEREAAAAEENLLRNRSITKEVVNPSAAPYYPEFIVEDIQRKGLDAIDQEGAVARLQKKLNPQKFSGVVGKDQVAYIDGVEAVRGPSSSTDFEGANMQIPGTDKVAFARTPQEFEANLEAGYVPIGKTVPGAPADKAPKDMFSDEKALRGEFDSKTSQFALMRDAYSKIRKVAEDPSPAGDISLIFSYMKMLDPGSTVREGEYATAQNAGSIPNSIWARYNQAVAGETLTPPQRQDFLRQSSNIYQSAEEQYLNDRKRYEDLAAQYKIDPRRVVYDRTGGVKAMDIPKYAAPKVGTVVDNYEYLGGDPNNKKSWRKR